jgi:hypothetical protein
MQPLRYQVPRLLHTEINQTGQFHTSSMVVTCCYTFTGIHIRVIIVLCLQNELNFKNCLSQHVSNTTLLLLRV